MRRHTSLLCVVGAPTRMQNERKIVLWNPKIRFLLPSNRVDTSASFSSRGNATSLRKAETSTSATTSATRFERCFSCSRCFLEKRASTASRWLVRVVSVVESVVQRACKRVSRSLYDVLQATVPSSPKVQNRVFAASAHTSRLLKQLLCASPRSRQNLLCARLAACAAKKRPSTPCGVRSCALEC